MSEPRFARVLDVNSVLELGYATHVANDERTAATKAGAIARQLLDEFYSWPAPPGTADHTYLFKTRELTLRLGNGITRRKATYLAEIEAADGKRAEDLARLSVARNDDFWMTFWLRTATAVGMMTIAAAIGFALAESVLPFVPASAQHKSEVDSAGWWPSIFVAGVFAAISRNLAKWLSQRRIERVFRDYERARHRAWLRYQREKLAEYEDIEEELRRLFTEYTGAAPVECLSYADILNEEIATDRSLERARQRLSESFLARTLAKFRRPRKPRRRKPQEATP